MPVILELERLRQEDCLKLKGSLNYKVWLCQKKEKLNDSKPDPCSRRVCVRLCAPSINQSIPSTHDEILPCSPPLPLMAAQEDTLSSAQTATSSKGLGSPPHTRDTF